MKLFTVVTVILSQPSCRMKMVFPLFKTLAVRMKSGGSRLCLSMCCLIWYNPLYLPLEKKWVRFQDHCPCRQPNTGSCTQSSHLNRVESVIWLNRTYQRWIFQTSFMKWSQWCEIENFFKVQIIYSSFVVCYPIKPVSMTHL